MARKALGAATLRIVQAVDALWQSPWLVAVSGGADSMALAAAAAIVARRRQHQPLRAVTVDHQLQQDSDVVAKTVVTQLAELDVPTTICRVDVAHADGPEADARTARYQALHQVADQWQVELGQPVGIALGHTLDDQAETVLLGLARGSGIRSLAGMASVAGRLYRPLLEIRRSDTEACCAELGITPWCDPHNEDSRLARVRVRRRLLPVLEAELGPGVAEALARTARLSRIDADLLDELASEVAIDAELECGQLAELHPAVRSRVLRRWLLGRGAREVTAATVAAVDALVCQWRGQRGVDLAGMSVVRVQGRLRSVAR